MPLEGFFTARLPAKFHPIRYYNDLMHELAVTESILKIATTHAQQAQASHVTDINIVLGQLSSIVDDSVQFYWDIISQETICSGSKLHFERIPAQLACMDCGTTYALEGELDVLPSLPQRPGEGRFR